MKKEKVKKSKKQILYSSSSLEQQKGTLKEECKGFFQLFNGGRSLLPLNC